MCPNGSQHEDQQDIVADELDTAMGAEETHSTEELNHTHHRPIDVRLQLQQVYWRNSDK